MPSVDELEQEVERLHGLCESKGLNSRGATDIFGRKFQVPVNAEHKATVFFPILWTGKQPHMRTFWAATIGFFCTFFSCFAPGAIGSYIRRDPPEGLGLEREQLVLAGNLAVSGTIVMRLVCGPMCDAWGARKTFIVLLMLGVPGMIMMIGAQNAGMFILARFLIGLSLATFVTCQVWCSQFFDRKIVGTVNATAGGWGNVGGGFTLLIMPQIMLALRDGTGDINASWRLCFILPLVMHFAAALFIWTGRDLPDGSYKDLETSGAKQKSKGGGNVAKLGFSNTNAWIMLVTYGLCFGVELTMNNRLVAYFENYYAIPNEIAGPLGATFSLMNLFARSWGGILSDKLATKWGLRGRITGMWIVQTLEGLMCIFLGLVTVGYDCPHDFPATAAEVNSTWDAPRWENPRFTTSFILPSETVAPCDSALVESPSHGYVNGVYTALPVTPGTWITVRDPNPDCIHNNADSLLPWTMVCIVLFSICVQMAEGLHFGIVPYISRPALGVVSGMVGAGGNTGAVIAGQYIIPAITAIDEGFIRLGAIIMGVSCLMLLIYFPEEGSILTGPGGLPFDPQIIKPDAGQKGADELAFDDKTKTAKSSTTGQSV